MFVSKCEFGLCVCLQFYKISNPIIYDTLHVIIMRRRNKFKRQKDKFKILLEFFSLISPTHYRRINQRVICHK